MKITKCLLIFLLVICVAMAAVACNPTEPENPEDPSGPSTPVDPSDPADPSDPVDPSGPSDPADPSEPVTPVKYTVTWQSGSIFTFTTETGEALPATQEVDNGSSLKFKVAVNDNTMGVTKVVAGDDTLTADENGVYTVVVNDDITVSALVQKLTIVSIEVTTEPTKKEYFAGDTLDTTGMVVTATYSNGTTETLTQYTVKYADGSALSTGDTSVTISSGEISCVVTGLTVRDNIPFENIAVTLSAVEGKPVLTVTGTLGTSTMAELAIKGCGKHNATMNGKDFTITVDLATVIAGAKSGDWLDLQLFHSASDYIDLTTDNATNYSDTVVYNDRKYFFANWDSQLKIVWEDASPFTSVSTTLAEVEGKPVLTVTGTLNTAALAALEIKGCGKHNATMNGKDFTITVDLATVMAGAKAGDWLDLKLYYTESSYLDLTTSDVADFNATCFYEGRKYFFAEWEGQLKIVWEGASTFESLNVTLESVEGTPTLTVTGKLGDAESATLEIKNCGKFNATMNGRDFTITVNLETALAGANSGDWLDLKLFYNDSSYIDLSTGDVADYSAVVNGAGRKYFFAEWEGALKIVWEAL